MFEMNDCAASFNNIWEAEIAKGLLNSAGIDAVIVKDDAGGFYRTLSFVSSNIKVMVRKEDKKKAVEILNNPPQGDEEEKDD